MVMSKTKYNNQEDQQEALDEEEYQADKQYEQGRLADDNVFSEYFEDDENKADRFTDDYHENFTDNIYDQVVDTKTYNTLYGLISWKRIKNAKEFKGNKRNIKSMLTRTIVIILYKRD